MHDERIATLENFTVPEQFFMENMMDGPEFESSLQEDDDPNDEQTRDFLSQIGTASGLERVGVSVASNQVFPFFLLLFCSVFCYINFNLCTLFRSPCNSDSKTDYHFVFSNLF